MLAPSKDRVLDFSKYPPHPGQLRVIEAMRKYKVVLHSPGRRWGKSSCRPYVILDQIGHYQGWVEGCAGTKDHSEAANVWEADLLNFTRLGIVRGSSGDDQRRHIDFAPVRRELADGSVSQNEGARVWYPSLGPDAHRGFQSHGLHFAIIDEFSHCPYAAWFETIRPMMATTRGPTLIIGSPIPEGINFVGFASEWELGNPANPERLATHYSTTGPSEENPYVDPEEIRVQREYLNRTGKAALAACLFDGRFVTDLGAVFTNLDSVFILKAREIEPGFWFYREARPDELVIIGIDFGRHEDATVITAFSFQTLEQLAVWRIELTEYLIQLPMIDRFVRRFPARQIWAEGREETAAELLRKRYGPSCALVKWANGGKFDKNSCVARGMDLFQTGGWTLINVEWQKEEFRQFARARLPSGTWKYGAPDGMHDDGVAAALYASYGLPMVPSRAREVEIETNLPPDPWVFHYAQQMEEQAKYPFVLRR